MRLRSEDLSNLAIWQMMTYCRYMGVVEGHTSHNVLGNTRHDNSHNNLGCEQQLMTGCTT